MSEVGQRCAAGTGCGGCRPTIRALVGALGGTKQLAKYTTTYATTYAAFDESGPCPAASASAEP